MPEQNRNRPWVRTARVAKDLGIHPNTLRWYEHHGYISPVPRTPTGYRMFTPEYRAQAQAAKLIISINWIFGPIRQQCAQFITTMRNRDYHTLPLLAETLEQTILREIELSKKACTIITHYLSPMRSQDTKSPSLPHHAPLTIGAAARVYQISPDQIRGWEANGMLSIPRDHRGFRIISPSEGELLLVIRYCRLAGYSITAIRRLLRSINLLPEITPSTLMNTLNTLATGEGEVFPTFPRDEWLSSLQQALESSRALILSSRNLSNFSN